MFDLQAELESRAKELNPRTRRGHRVRRTISPPQASTVATNISVDAITDSLQRAGILDAQGELLDKISA